MRRAGGGGSSSRVPLGTSEHRAHGRRARACSVFCEQSRNPAVPEGAAATTEGGQTPPSNNQVGPDDGPTDLSVDHDWIQLTYLRHYTTLMTELTV